MAKGFCSSCGMALGGIGLKPEGYICPGCGKMFCKNCSPQRGITKHPYCPNCGRKLEG